MVTTCNEQKKKSGTLSTISTMHRPGLDAM